MVTIYVGSEPILSVEVDDKSYRYRKLESVDQLVLYFALDYYVQIPVGAYVVYQNERFELTTPSALKMVHTRNYEYTLTMLAASSKLESVFFRDTVDGRLSFSLTAKPLLHLEKLVACLGSGWSVGSCIDANEKVVNYDYMTCREALDAMVKEFGTEFEIVSAGNSNTISLKKVEYNKESPLDLSYGKGMGFRPNIQRSSSSVPVDVLVLQTSDRNIDYTKYGFKSLRLPAAGTALWYNGTEFSNAAADGYRKYVVCSDRLSIKRGDRDITTGAEACLKATDIYPTETHTIRSVDTSNPCIFRVNNTPAVDYGQYRIAGEVMTVVFQTGELAGREFDIVSTTSSLTGYNHSERKFKIVADTEAGESIPNAVLKPSVGDTLKVFHCALPDAYICDDVNRRGASWELFKAAIKKLYGEEDQKYSISGELDPIYANADWENVGGKVVVGGYVRYTGDMMEGGEAVIRIVGVKDYVNSPHAPVIELSNDEVSSHVAAALKQIESDSKVSVEKTGSDVMGFARRRWEDAQATIAMLEEAIEGYDASIKPASVQTLLMLVGDESLQFRFEAGRDNSSEIQPTLSFNRTTKRFSASIGSGVLHHLTLGNTAMSADVKGVYRWTLSSLTSAVLDDPLKSYYLYAKCYDSGEELTEDSRSAFILSTEAHKLHEDGYYYFLVGCLLEEQDNGSRAFNTVYGYTQISGGRITTSRIEDADGLCFFDLANGTFVIGDDDHYVHWNMNNDGRLVIKGGVNIAGDGTAIPTLNPKGVYDEATTYYYGDLITYSDGNQYFRVSATALSGHNPIDYPSEWQLYNVGARSIAAQDVKYGRSTNRTSYPSSWKSTPEEVVITDAYPYFWTRTIVSYTDGTTADPVYSFTVKGSKGSTGATGATGETGATGATGATGQSVFKSIVFKRTNDTPDTPLDSQGSFFHPVPTGWSDGVPAADASGNAAAKLWMTTRIFTSDGLSPAGSWTTPQPATDTADTDYEYNNGVTYDGAPLKDSPAADVPAGGDANGWYDASDATMSLEDAVWMAKRKIKNGVYDGDWEILHIKGEKGDKGDTGDKGDKGDKGDTGDSGQDGSSILYEYARKSTSGAPTTGWQYTPFTPQQQSGFYVWEHQLVYDSSLQVHVLDGTYEYPEGTGIYPNTVRLIHDPNAEASEKAARDDIAKSLGYSSWDDFENHVALGEVIIEGGYLKSSLIDTEALIASLMTTGLSGERVVITGDDITIYREDNTPAVYVGGGKAYYTTDSFAGEQQVAQPTIYAGSASGSVNLFTFSNFQTVSIGYDPVIEIGNSFYLEYPCRVESSSFPRLSLYINSLASLTLSNVELWVSLAFINQETGVAYTIARAKFTELGTSASTLVASMNTVYLGAGNYKAALTLSGFFNFEAAESVSRTLSFALANTFSPVLTASGNKTEMFANGFGYKLDANNYNVTFGDANYASWGVQSGIATSKYGLKVEHDKLQGVAGGTEYRNVMIIELAAYFTTTSSGITCTSQYSQTGNSVSSCIRASQGQYSVNFARSIGNSPVMVTPYKSGTSTPCLAYLSTKGTTNVVVKATTSSASATELSGFSILIIKTT